MNGPASRRPDGSARAAPLVLRPGPVTSSVSGNQSMGTGWRLAFRHVDTRFGVSGIERVCPRLSAGPYPRDAPMVTAQEAPEGMRSHIQRRCPLPRGSAAGYWYRASSKLVVCLRGVLTPPKY